MLLFRTILELKMCDLPPLSVFCLDFLPGAVDR